MQQGEHSSIVDGHANFYTENGNQYGIVLGNVELVKIKTQLSNSWPYAQRMFLPTKKDTCPTIFIGALLITSQTQKQHKCPLNEELTRKMWFIYVMEYLLCSG